jgi:putative PEP-CTERM system histidine kinase
VNIGLFSYLFAAVAFSVLTILLIFSWRGWQLGTSVTVASALSAVWAVISAISTLYPTLPLELMQAAELARLASWCFFLLKIIELKQDDESTSSGKTIYTSLFFLILILAIFFIFVVPIISRSMGLADTLETEAGLISWLVYSVIGMLLVEQIYRNSRISERWAIKYLCLGIGGIFAYDFFMFSDALLFKQINPDLWNARGLVNGIAVPLIAISIARTPTFGMDIHVSRHVVFHSATLMGAGIYLLLMATAGYFIRFYGGTWGGVLQIAFLCGAGILLFVLLFSGNIRAKIRVFLSKHFFSYKYDYREEWSKFTRTLNENEQDVPERIIRAITALVNSTGGMLWAKKDNLEQYELVAEWNMAIEPESVNNASLKSLDAFIEKNQWVVDIDEYNQEPETYDGLEIPDWLISIPGAWLVIPLLFKNHVLGLVLVKRSDVQNSINWEDRDLLKIAGQQAASHLAQHQSDQSLIQARQFEAFSRLSAYVIHDLKNILAQQSLIVTNAKKHRQNPAFIDDVIHTVENSVTRMTRLMEQMRSGERGFSPSDINLSTVLSRVITQHSKQQPVPVLESIDSDPIVYADRLQLTTVVGHIIQNAQEATDENGQIFVRLAVTGNQAVIEIEDTGSGMDSDFIRDNLFKPFSSTKGLTGMGIGLFESREYIRSLGGEISVKSAPGLGTKFSIKLPLIMPSVDLPEYTVIEENL